MGELERGNKKENFLDFGLGDLGPVQRECEDLRQTPFHRHLTEERKGRKQYFVENLGFKAHVWGFRKNQVSYLLNPNCLAV